MNIENLRFIAHRGLHIKNTDIVENSIPAFLLAVENNIAIELDVHLIKDENIVVVHDSNLKNVGNIDITVENMTLEEIKKIKLFGTENKIPTFFEVLKVIDGKVPLIIEIKNSGKCGKLEEKLYEMLKNYNGKYLIESFNPLSLLWFKKNANNVLRGQLSAKKIDSISSFLNFFLSKMVFNFLTKPDFIAYNISDLNEKMYKKYSKKGISVISWTLKNKEEYFNNKDICDSFIFDNYEELKNIIEGKNYEKEK